MPVEAEVRGATPPEFEVIGTGTIGEKARQLQEKTPRLKEIGFNVPQRTVLADSFFQGFLSSNGISMDATDSDIEERVKFGSLAEGQDLVLQKIRDKYKGVPLVIRSSAEGDARGAGRYKSEFVDGTVEGNKKGLVEVYASYFSDDAKLFRRDAGLEEGFGVIIEPIVGQLVDEENIAPILSGYGYTSTVKEGLYIAVVSGLGSGVNTRYREKVTRGDMEAVGYHFGEYIKREEERFWTGRRRKKSAMLGTARDGVTVTSTMVGDTFWLGNARELPQVAQKRFYYDKFVDQTVREADLRMDAFFDMIGQMEAQFGKPQYIEWAMTYEKGEPKYWILQVANMERELESGEFNESGDVLYTGHTVRGNGVKTCSKIVYCYSWEDVKKLAEFNAKNEGYILVYDSNFTSSGAIGREKNFDKSATGLTYANCNNASIFVERTNYEHSGDPEEHLLGMMDMTRKFFAVMEPFRRTPQDQARLKGLMEMRETEDGITVINGKFKVVASEREDRLEIYKQE